MIKTLFKIFTLVILTSGSALAQKDLRNAVHYKTEWFEVAIFPASNQDILTREKRFTPTKEQVNLAELALVQKLEKLNYYLMNQTSTPVIHTNLHNYLRQYIGYINKQGQHILLINSFWHNIDRTHNKYWLKMRVVVDFGGSFYWNVKYNIETGELFDLRVNSNDI